eukprot:TRINITY_DN13955_c0_g1_i4.p1 TRINITY_DN13955_c0_g1~~TRINITY_DN13955_c0_g1_i4.p1  ORF type:complete len:491 (+),score=95.19 TRINITY_DN13955_c0_g1_i4:215-1687(+)
MVLEEIGQRITKALSSMSQASQIDQQVFDECIKEICNTLVRSDVEAKLVFQLRNNIKKRVNFEELAAGIDKRKVIEKAVHDELCTLLDGSGDSEKKLYELKKGKQNVVMFVGLQGNGKTTTCMKYAYYYKKKGFKPAMVCADTYRAGAFDQLKQNATKAQVPYYGSYSETDPAVIARNGVDKFLDEKKDLIIVDTSGRHMQSEALFEEMRQVAKEVEPSLVVFVMDATTGQSAGDQARAFKESVEVGGVIITKMDGSAKGGSTLSAVAATRSPVVFLGTGEHMDALEPFDTKAFVGKLLGRGDIKGLTQQLEDVMPEEKQEQFMKMMQKGNFTMRLFREFIENVGQMGPLSAVMQKLPFFSNMPMQAGNDRETSAKFRRFLTIMDSMTEKELDERDVRKLMEDSRIYRLAYGSGRAIIEVREMLENYKMMAKSAEKLAQVTKGFNPRNMNQSISQIGNAVPPHLLRQMGGAQGLETLMKQMQKMPGGLKM